MTDGRHRTPRFTVDDLFDLLPTLTTGREPGRPGPLAGVRAEVLDGRLLLAPPPLRRHERVADNLAARLRLVLPGVAQVSRHDAVRLPDGDGPVPDLLVTTERDWPRGWPAAAVHTVAEVVTADGRHIDRVWKRERYADAGIPCFWRVELAAWPGYRGRCRWWRSGSGSTPAGGTWSRRPGGCTPCRSRTAATATGRRWPCRSGSIR